jgi:hypothetical protein
VPYDAFYLELCCNKEETDKTKLIAGYTINIGENNRKNLRVVSALIMSSTNPAIPNPMSSPLFYKIITLR